MAFTDKN